jgi:glycerophosphoryl diester phosphodiesterase
MDLHLTRDGEIVVIHDPDLTRTTDGSGAIGMMTLAEIRRYNAAAKYTGPGSWGVQPVPTLREVLDLVRPTKVQLEMEIKTPPGGRYQGIEQKVVDLLSQVGMLDRAVISSFNLDILSDLHKIAPSLRTEALVSRTTVPPGTTPQALVADVVARGVRILAPSSTFLTPELLKEAKAKGLEVRTWTVNTEGEMRLLIAMGVDGIITNRPDILREVLRR